MDQESLDASARRRALAARRTRVLDAALFRSALIRERKRAERSGASVVLVLVARRGGRRSAPSAWRPVIERLAAATNGIDVMGWYEPGAAIGVIRPLFRRTESIGFDEQGADDLGAALGHSFAEDIGDGFSVRVLLHPQPIPVTGEFVEGVAGAFYPELVFRSARARARDAAKRALDILGSLVGLALLAPGLGAIALLVRLTSAGPALFRQPRVGYLMQPFTVRKFRTMYTHADPTVHQEYVSRFIAGGVSNDDVPPNGLFKLTNDRRITPLGRFLRKTSLDELPQLWNVLRGDMSLVGPRPPLPYECEQYQPWHRRRVLDVKPGLTGLWQIKGRSRTTFDDMVRLDLRYARTRSLWGDLAIICRTPAAVISGKGAC